MIPKALLSGCGMCGEKKGVLRSAGCKVMPYCSRGHQIEHRQEHKAACNIIKKDREFLEQHERILRMRPLSPFPNAFGSFWILPETQPYMLVRLNLTNSLDLIDSFEAAEAQLDNFMEMMRLYHHDMMGAQGPASHLLLRLNRDQECYGFMKWWNIKSCEPQWLDPERPFLEIKDTDAFEDLSWLYEQEIDDVMPGNFMFP